MDNSFVLKGNFVYSKDKNNIVVKENSYCVCENGISKGVFEVLDEKYKSLPLIDCKDSVIFPGFTDLHLHAPQYGFRGIGGDRELLDWLETYTFKEEAKYNDIEYAKKGYKIFADDMKEGFVTRAVVFAQINVEATLLLMEYLEESGLITYVGKVNMDRNSPDYLIEENALSSAEDTLKWIEKSKKFERTKPIVTPRFVPSCTDELMERLGKIAEKYSLPVQSHLSENRSEIEWVKELNPKSKSYADAYDMFGLFGGDVKTVMAHCVSCTEEECDLIKNKGVFVAHCPQSNLNLTSGIAPIKKYLDNGVKIGLGSDIGAGYSISVPRAMADAVQCSKMYKRYVDENVDALTFEEALYMGTLGGGEFFGKVGSFEEGYEFDAVAVDDSNIKSPMELSVRNRAERIMYLSEKCTVNHKFVKGQKII